MVRCYWWDHWVLVIVEHVSKLCKVLRCHCEVLCKKRKVNVKVVDLYSAFTRSISKPLRYSTHCQRITQFYLHTLCFIRKRNEPYLPLPSQPQLVLIYWPQWWKAEWTLVRSIPGRDSNLQPPDCKSGTLPHRHKRTCMCLSHLYVCLSHVYVSVSPVCVCLTCMCLPHLYVYLSHLYVCLFARLHGTACSSGRCSVPTN